MKRYKGQFKDINDNTIYVEIVPSDNNYTETIEIKFPYDEPIQIKSKSKGIFTPIKQTQCTITIFSEEIYWDLYTPTVTDYYVKVWNNTNTLFCGYLTPCIYSQDYVTKAEIELEAVDAIAVLKEIDYTPIGSTKDIISVNALLNHILLKLPNQIVFENNSSINFANYYVQESNFFDDDGEPMNCQEILNELMKYIGCTALMYNGKIYFIDYNKIGTTNLKTLTIDKYGKGTPSVSLDDVYNKIEIDVDLYEVDDIIKDVIDSENKTIVNELKVNSSNQQIFCDYALSWREWYHHTQDKDRWTLMCKPYTFWKDETNKEFTKSNWNTYDREIESMSLISNLSIETRSANDCGKYKDSSNNSVFVPYYCGAYPIRTYSYNKETGLDNSKVSFDDFIYFPKSSNATSFPALTYKMGEKLAYSISEGTSYIIIDAKIFINGDVKEIEGGEDLDYGACYFKPINKATGQEELKPIPVPLDIDIPFEKYKLEILERDTTSANYNKGFSFFTAQLKIGNKYWNGSVWTTTPSTFTLNFHDDDVQSEAETFSFYKWEKIAFNPNVKRYEIGDNGYAIPIKPNDYVNGEFEFTIYSPSNERGSKFVGYFLKDLKVTYAYKDSQHWADDKKNDDDIIYENIINENYAKTMDELTLKINSWYRNKPISKSYLLNSNKMPVIEINNKIQEVNLLEKYYNHYSTPRKIFELNYKITDMNPFNSYYHTQTDTTYYVDSYKMNVKMGETKLKLIEL